MKKTVYKKANFEVREETLKLINEYKQLTEQTQKKTVNDRLVLGLKTLMKGLSK